MRFDDGVIHTDQIVVEVEDPSWRGFLAIIDVLLDNALASTTIDLRTKAGKVNGRSFSQFLLPEERFLSLDERFGSFHFLLSLSLLFGFGALGLTVLQVSYFLGT